jgi:hypothetical protein
VVHRHGEEGVRVSVPLRQRVFEGADGLQREKRKNYMQCFIDAI